MRLETTGLIPLNSHRLLHELAQQIQGEASPVLRGAFAYATMGGVQAFLAKMRSASNWGAIEKEFVVGIHQAITEPSALRELMLVPGLSLRVLVPGGRLTAETFRDPPFFHPKMLAVTAGGRLKLIQAGSNNMSSAAMAQKPRNYEMSLTASASHNSALDGRAFARWWSVVWGSSRPVNTQFIARYAELRRDALARNPILRFSGDVPPSIARAQFFFIEVGAASGPPQSRHQVEFPESLARYFGRPVRGRRDMTLQRGGLIWTGRPLSYKRTTFGVEIWRLGMPTQATGGAPIARRAIRFRRTSAANAFQYEVVNAGSADYSEWVRQANLRGHLGATHGGGSRQYGFY